MFIYFSNNYLYTRITHAFQSTPSGLLCSFDTVTPEVTNKLKAFAYEKNMLIISCGTQTVRFRPVLDSKKEHFDIAARILREALAHIDRENKKAAL